MKKHKLVIYGLFALLAIVALFMLFKMFMSSGNDKHDHSKDGCHCECEFSSNQNEKSCKDHGGCEWTDGQCITKK